MSYICVLQSLATKYIAALASTTTNNNYHCLRPQTNTPTSLVLLPQLGTAMRIRERATIKTPLLAAALLYPTVLLSWSRSITPVSRHSLYHTQSLRHLQKTILTTTKTLFLLLFSLQTTITTTTTTTRNPTFSTFFSLQTTLTTTKKPNILYLFFFFSRHSCKNIDISARHFNTLVFLFSFCDW